MRQGDRGGALQGCVYGQLTQAVVNARHLAVHGPARDDAHLRSKSGDDNGVDQTPELVNEPLTPKVKLQKFNILGPN